MTAGEPGTPLPKKLGIKPGHRVLVLGRAPDGFLADAEDATVTWRATTRPVDVVVLFVTSQEDLVAHLDPARNAMVVDGGLWVAWPKKASGVATDMTEDIIRELMPPTMVDNKVCAIDEVWSGLRLVVRREHRGG